MKTLMHIGAVMLALLLGACTAPYQPPLLVYGAAPFAGIAQTLAASPDKRVDVFLIHGICTHDRHWADAAIDALLAAAGPAGLRERPTPPRQIAGIELVQRSERIAGGTIRFSALIWSGMTQPLKRELDYDATGAPSDCGLAGECKPTRAKLNGRLKDKLINDCLADAVVYQGVSKPLIRKAMIAAMTSVIEGNAAQDARAGLAAPPLLVVSESLGSKIAFDAMVEMFNAVVGSREKSAADKATQQLSYIYMAANQLPFLALAERQLEAPTEGGAAADSLDKLLRLASAQKRLGSQISIVAFTDPNDLLAYRLMPWRYGTPGVTVADVLVSNDKTYLGLLENPLSAHTGYLKNLAVTGAIMCGMPTSEYCR